jgi:hypothetical protein
MHAPWVRLFLDQLAIDGNVSRSATASGISSTTAYALKRSDADFAAAWDIALEDASDTLEAEARRRAVKGIQKPVVYQGQLTPVWARDASGDLILEEYDAPAPPGLKDADGEPVKTVKQSRPVQARDPNGQPLWLTITEYSDPLLALLLKGRRKKVFADRTELTGADGGPVVTTDATQRRARIASILEAAKSRVGLA